MASGPDLFVVCKNCREQVSPYVTECPYCGTRIRKRAPKLERAGGDLAEPQAKRRRRAPAMPKLPPLRTGELPGVRGEATDRPVVTLSLVAASVVLYLVTVVVLDRGDLVVTGLAGEEAWRIFTAPFVYDNAWYGLAALSVLGIFGWLLERRHGHVAVLVLFLAAGSGGMAVAALTGGLAAGANGAALGMLAAWALPDVLARRRGESDDESDLLGAFVLALLLVLLPAVVDEASAVAGLVGLALGALLGVPLARLQARG